MTASENGRSSARLIAPMRNRVYVLVCSLPIRLLIQNIYFWFRIDFWCKTPPAQEPQSRRVSGRHALRAVQEQHRGTNGRLCLDEDVRLLHVPSRAVPRALPQAVQNRDGFLHDQGQVWRLPAEQERRWADK